MDLDFVGVISLPLSQAVMANSIALSILYHDIAAPGQASSARA